MKCQLIDFNVKHFWLIILVIVTFSSCDNIINYLWSVGEGEPLTIRPSQANTDLLSLDGFYYRIIEVNPDSVIRYQIVFLNENGRCSFFNFSAKNTEQLRFKLKNCDWGQLLENRTVWGVFTIDSNKEITLQRWLSGQGVDPVYSYLGEIQTNTTFKLNESLKVGKNESPTLIDYTFQFQQFDLKPDSTTRYIP